MTDEVNARISSAVRELRGRANISQEDLAAGVGLGSGQIISQIEKGERSLKANEVVRFAEFFRVATDVLLTGEMPKENSEVFWRGEADLAGRAEDEALFFDRCRRYAFVEELVGEYSPSTVPRYDLDLARASFEDVEKLADDVRNALRVGDRPGPVLRAALENEWKVKIFFSDLQSGSGAAVRGDFGDAITENSGEAEGRRAFSVAHELFHLVTWNSGVAQIPDLTDTQKRRVEQLANVFASALLLPAKELKREVYNSGVEQGARLLDVVGACRAFSVSAAALAWRAVNLGWLAAENVDQVISAIRGKRAMMDSNLSSEEGGNSHELPERFVLLAFRAFVGGQISIGKLAKLLETTVGMLNPTLAAYGLDLDSDAYQTEILSA